ncbi:MAG TPA: cytochrome c [Chitinophagaceae bacterium]|nr:cytochrome c [Chitinophagaceae bacterium]
MKTFDNFIFRTIFMTAKYLLANFLFIGWLMSSCDTGTQKQNQPAGTAPNKTDTVVISQGSNTKGIGRFKEVSLTHPLDQDMIAKAQVIYNAKCFACHKLTTEKLVGPGWKGVTDRRAPEWILNFVTNTQVMLDKDLVAQSELVTCVVRMPNQGLTDEQARQMLEFMRNNDGKN